MPSKIPPRTLLGVVLLAGLTIPLTWKAKSLDKKLFGRGDLTAMVNKPAPAFSLKSLSGETVSLAEFKEKKTVVVSFWASWCGPCRLELPQLEAFYEKYHPKNDKFEVLAISMDSNAADAKQYAKEAKLTFPILMDADGRAGDSFGVEGIPTLFVIDQNGQITHVQEGFEGMLEYQLVGYLGLKLDNKAAGEEQ